MQGATQANSTPFPFGIDFNPRSLCRERPMDCASFFPGAISIHAPYAGSDTVYFLIVIYREISIHAPYAGSDRLGI